MQGKGAVQVRAIELSLYGGHARNVTLLEPTRERVELWALPTAPDERNLIFPCLPRAPLCNLSPKAGLHCLPNATGTGRAAIGWREHRAGVEGQKR